MPDIEMREIENSGVMQHAELRIPIEMTGLTFQEVANALASVEKIRELALGHVGVTEDNADATAVDYKLDGEMIVVNVIQVNA